MSNLVLQNRDAMQERSAYSLCKKHYVDNNNESLNQYLFHAITVREVIGFSGIVEAQLKDNN